MSNIKSELNTLTVHPGEILLEEFLNPFELSQYRLSKEIGVPPRRINEIVHGTRSITADTALRLAKFFGTSPEFWMNLQVKFDLVKNRTHIAEILDKRVTRFTFQKI